MGGFISTIYDFFSTKKNMLMLGLDSAGKTTILYQLKLNDYRHTVPTIGFNVETIKYKNLDLTIWDIGGQAKIRKLWRHYYNNIDTVIFVIDSNDVDRLPLVKEELHHVLSDNQLKHCSVLIYSNKIDLPNSIDPTEIAKEVDLYSLKQKWYIQPCCALNETSGIYEGLNWIKNQDN